MKPPEILHIEQALVDKAVSLWKAGQLVAMPTETVYGLGADAMNGLAVASIYRVKSRPQFNPLIIHVADLATAERYVQFTSAAEKLAEAFWPGPLTLVLKRKPNSQVSDLVSAGGDTLAIRCPAHPVAQQLLRAFGGGIAAPSANRSGRISPTTAAHVAAELADAIPLILDGGPCRVGVESTVVDVTGEVPVLLRPGSITRTMLEAVVGTVSDTQQVSGGKLLSPGQLESHYAPTLPVRLNASTVEAGEAMLGYGNQAGTLNLSETGDLTEAAANLFAHLRALDDPRYTGIAIAPIPTEGVGEAINDRLSRAAVRT